MNILELKDNPSCRGSRDIQDRVFPELHQRDVDHRCQKDQLPVEETEHRTRLAEQVDSEQGDLRDPNAGGRDQTGRCRAESIEGILNDLRFLEGSQNSYRLQDSFMSVQTSFAPQRHDTCPGKQGSCLRVHRACFTHLFRSLLHINH